MGSYCDVLYIQSVELMIFVVFDQFYSKVLHLQWATLESEIKLGKKKSQVFHG